MACATVRERLAEVEVGEAIVDVKNDVKRKMYRLLRAKDESTCET